MKHEKYAVVTVEGFQLKVDCVLITVCNIFTQVIPVTMHSVSGGSGTVGIAQCLDHMIQAVKTKVLELKTHFPNRPIVLIGWGVGALIACEVKI